jgi:sirohydrochlorin ferrochelatase
VGVILVGHGQPAEWDREFPTETEHELLFREQILHRFEADGNRMENMEQAWMEFREPQPAEKVEALIMNRVEKIFYFPDAISADSIHSQYDIPELMGEAKVPAGFTLVNLEAWNDHPLVIQAIKDKIQSAQNMGSQ